MTYLSLSIASLSVVNVSAIAALICILAFSTLLSKKRLSTRPLRFAAVIALNVVVVCAVAVLLIGAPVDRYSDDPIVLITDQQQSQTNDMKFSEVTEEANSTRIFRLNTAITADPEGGKESGVELHRSVESPIDAMELVEGANGIVVFGSGLSESNLAMLSEDVKFEFYPAPLSGLIDVTWNKQLIVGQQLKINARLLAEQATQVVLLDPVGNEVIRKLVLPNSPLVLRHTPKSRGLFSYTLQTQTSDGLVLFDQPLSINVIESTPFNVSIKTASPSFETRAIKNWLGQYGVSVFNVSKVGEKAIFDTRVNSANDESDSSSTADKKPDALIIDARMLVSLNPSEQQKLRQRIEDGMGMIVLAGATLVNSDIAKALFSGTRLSIDNDRISDASASAILVWNGASDMPVANISKLTISSNIPAIVEDENGRALVTKTRVGKGVVLLSNITRSYTWNTQGRADIYSEFWSMMLEHVVQRDNDLSIIEQAESERMLVNHKHSLCVLAWDIEGDVQDEVKISVKSLGEIHTNNYTSVHVGTDLHCVDFIPNVAGWHQLNVESARDPVVRKQMLYVYPESSWRLQQLVERQRATEKRAEPKEQKEKQNIREQYRGYNVQLLGLLLLSALLLLWLERKLWQQNIDKQ